MKKKDSKKDITNSFVNVQGWMVQKLNLSGNELLAYALIYGFSQEENTKFTGSINYVSTWLNCSKPTVIKTLLELCKKELVFKESFEVNNVQFNTYKANLQVVKNIDWGSKNDSDGGSKENLPNNIYKDNIDNNIYSNNTPPQKNENLKSKKSKKEVEVIEEKFPFGEHQNVKLSLDEKEKLLQRWGADVFQQIVDKLSNYKLSSGTKYKSDYGAINNWVAKQVEKDNRFSKPLNNNNNGNSQSKSGKQYFNLEPGWSNLTGDEWWMRPYTYTGGDGEDDNVPK